MLLKEVHDCVRIESEIPVGQERERTGGKRFAIIRGNCGGCRSGMDLSCDCRTDLCDGGGNVVYHLFGTPDGGGTQNEKKERRGNHAVFGFCDVGIFRGYRLGK